MGRGPAVAVVLTAMLVSGASGADSESAPATEPHAGDATANLPAQSPTAAAVPDPPPVLGPRLRQENPGTRLETEPPRRGPELPAAEALGRDQGTGATQHGGSHATTNRLPQPPDTVLGMAASPASRAGPEPDASLQTCVDRALAARGLNGFGDPPGTQYPQGVPVDPSSLARYDYVLHRSPSIRGECLTTTPFH